MRWIATIVVLSIVVKCLASEFRQEHAVVEVCNHKWFKDCFCITRRMKRGEKYRTNCTFINLYEISNNVTVKVSVERESFPELVIVKVKSCDALKIEWVAKFYGAYSNMDPTLCPLPPGDVILNNMEFPPKNMPQYVYSLIKGKFKTQVLMMASKTEEIILKASIVLYSK